MKKVRKLILGSFVIFILLTGSFFTGYTIGYRKEFYSTKVVEGMCEERVKIRATIYNREWTSIFYKDVVCSKKDKRKTLRQLKQDCKIIIKIDELEGGGEWHLNKRHKSVNVKPPKLRQIKN